MHSSQFQLYSYCSVLLSVIVQQLQQISAFIISTTATLVQCSQLQYNRSCCFDAILQFFKGMGFYKSLSIFQKSSAVQRIGSLMYLVHCNTFVNFHAFCTSEFFLYKSIIAFCTNAFSASWYKSAIYQAYKTSSSGQLTQLIY